MTGQLELEELQVDDPSAQEDADAATAVRYTISSYGADYPVDMLISRVERGDIEVPQFQRGYVWSHSQASRFIESLLLGLPVPGVFFSKESDSGRLLVIDGQQRLLTLTQFYKGEIHGKEFALRGVNEDLEGVTYESLPEEDQRRLNDSIIHATIVRQDDPEGDDSSIYLIFERLNTGGTPLSPQEIRTCVYRGPFSELLAELNQNGTWRDIYGPVSKRMKDQELILRFLALFYDLDGYERPMKLFLSRFMKRNQHLEAFSAEALRTLFDRTVEFAANLPRRVFRPERNLNAAHLDAILVGLARRLSQGAIDNLDALADASLRVAAADDFISKTGTGTTDAPNVRKRIELATKALSRVP